MPRVFKDFVRASKNDPPKLHRLDVDTVLHPSGPDANGDSYMIKLRGQARERLPLFDC